MIINPYKKGSKSVYALKEALLAEGVRCVVLQRPPNLKAAQIINWGNSEFQYDHRQFRKCINRPENLGVLTNKLRFFNHVGHVDSVPEWTTDRNVAAEWDKGMARTVLEGHSGAGIVVFNKGEEISRAPLYVKYQKKTAEYRVHCFRLPNQQDFQARLVQRKIFQKRDGVEAPASWDVRNHANGFVFVREWGEPVPERVTATATGFLRDHFPEMNFCALDVIDHNTGTFVLEGNTAPGLEGNTVQVYANFLKECTR